jgi:hypothetical protein
MTWSEAHDPEFQFSHGDPRPLVILPGGPRAAWRLHHQAARAWAKAHPAAVGYLEIPYDDHGSAFYTVERGRAYASACYHCRPRLHAYLVRKDPPNKTAAHLDAWARLLAPRRRPSRPRRA